MSVHPRFEAAVRKLAAREAPPAILQNIVAEQDVLTRFGVDSLLKIAHFLGQTAHESGGFRIMAENLRYTSGARLSKIWPKRFPDEAAAAPYVDNPEALANAVYAGRMGNGPADSGDGFRFRGRGLIQLTGRANYDAVGRLVGLPLIAQPELAEAPNNCLLIACGAWKHIGAAALPETASVEDFTRKVNGGLNGLDDRIRLFELAKAVLSEAAPV